MKLYILSFEWKRHSEFVQVIDNVCANKLDDLIDIDLYPKV